MFSSLVWFAFYSAIGIADLVSGYLVDITNNGPVVQGATVQFKVEIFEDSGKKSHNRFYYHWQDVKFPENNATYESTSPVTYWNLTCNSKYDPGVYQVHLVIEEKHKVLFFLETKVIDKIINFTVSRTLNGELVLSQRNTTRRKYIDNSMILNQTVVLKTPDMEFINVSKNFIKSFWFVDCIYYGHMNGFQFGFNYSQPESKHLVQALVVATTVPVNFTLDEPILANDTDSKNKSSSDVLDPDREFKEWLVTYNKTHVKGSYNFSFSDACLDLSNIPLNNDYTYGLFSSNFTVKDRDLPETNEPVKVSPINGTSWLKFGEILNITVSCTGSSPYKYCIWLRSGLYNVTGKEVCEEERLIKNCSFNIQHLFIKNTEYTVIVFISNSVSQVIKPIAVNIYKVTKHPQLSVIIVPVAFSIVAVILIIFGVAFYVQSKRSYTVEVADFDFANQSSDMEYKSFRDRLKESVSNLFLKPNEFDDDEQVWSPNRKYGSMQ